MGWGRLTRGQKQVGGTLVGRKKEGNKKKKKLNKIKFMNIGGIKSPQEDNSPSLLFLYSIYALLLFLSFPQNFLVLMCLATVFQPKSEGSGSKMGQRHVSKGSKKEKRRKRGQKWLGEALARGQKWVRGTLVGGEKEIKDYRYSVYCCFIIIFLIYSSRTSLS